MTLKYLANGCGWEIFRSEILSLDIFVIRESLSKTQGFVSHCSTTVHSSEVYWTRFPLWKVEAKADKPLDIVAFARSSRMNC